MGAFLSHVVQLNAQIIIIGKQLQMEARTMFPGDNWQELIINVALEGMPDVKTSGCGRVTTLLENLNVVVGAIFNATNTDFPVPTRCIVRQACNITRPEIVWLMNHIDQIIGSCDDTS